MSDLSSIDDAERLRIDDDADRAAFGRREDGGSPIGAVVFVATKTVSSYPTAAGKFFACAPRAITGAEVEGGAGTATALTGTYFAYLPVGAPVPASGAEACIAFLADRWVLLL